MSAGRTSDANNSMMEGLSVSAIPSNMNDSVPKITNQSLSFITAKAKQRDFKVAPRTLKYINGADYDKVEDMSSIAINIEAAFEKLQVQWKTWDEDRLIYMIRKQTIQDLTMIEERKKARTEQQEKDRKRREKLEMEREEMEAQQAMGVSMMNKSGMLGGTGKGGVSFLDKSQTSSPTKFGSPMRRTFTGAESMTDAQSTMTGGMSRGSPMKGAEANLMSLLNNQVGGI